MIPALAQGSDFDSVLATRLMENVEFGPEYNWSCTNFLELFLRKHPTKTQHHLRPELLPTMTLPCHNHASSVWA